MSLSDIRPTPRVIAAALTGLIAVSAGAWWITTGAPVEPDQNADLPADLTVDSLRKQVSEDPTKLAHTMATLSRDDLTDEQRRAARRNMRAVMTERLDKNISEYFAADETQRQAVLDRQIDEFVKWREQMRESFEARRRERQAEQRQRGDEPSTEQQQQQRRRRFLGDQSERKARAENRSADKIARRMAYFAAARARMAQRGIESGFGRRGGQNGSQNRSSNNSARPSSPPPQ